MINELPHKVRRKYIILGGPYIGPREPSLNVYLKPFVEEANKLSGEGFSWSLNGVHVISKGIPMCAVADSPARAKLLNMQGHIANWGCTYCYHDKSRTNTSNIRKYLITVGVAKRTLESTDEDVRTAFTKQHFPEKKDRQHRGVYGPSRIAKLNYFDITKNAPVDYMHCLLLGAVRSHTNLLLDTDGKKKYWNLDAHHHETQMKDIIDLIDKRLLEIKPPKSITRPPQSLLKRSGWKASERRSWILFYCIVCLQGILKEEYLVHLAKLSAAIFILLQDSVSVKEVHDAHALLVSYQCDFQALFV
ncbi:hypothetical protein FOCC_FOCC007338 [Frankliniella occidentalis]|nr:hypothetical protein FOCC_FOCC007338 [Frankliniella occidentalis]